MPPPAVLAQRAREHVALGAVAQRATIEAVGRNPGAARGIGEAGQGLVADVLPVQFLLDVRSHRLSFLRNALLPALVDRFVIGLACCRPS